MNIKKLSDIDFHDSSLLSIALDWSSGELKISFKLSDVHATAVTLLAKETNLFVCKRDFPWGKSVSINEVAVEEKEAFRRILVRVQSGDDLEIGCRDAFVRVEP
jgi:hypothetical protein